MRRAVPPPFSIRTPGGPELTKPQYVFTFDYSVRRVGGQAHRPDDRMRGP